MKSKPRTIDEYLAALSDDQRRALEKLRRAVRAAAPRAEECLSYQLPAFRLDGRMLVAFGAGAKHCSLYLMSSSTVGVHQHELQGYDTSKGTVRFPPGRPLPAALVRKLVKARVAENESMDDAVGGSSTPADPPGGRRKRVARPRRGRKPARLQSGVGPAAVS